MTGTERPGRSLAMDKKLFAPAVNGVRLALAGVVRHVVEQGQPRARKYVREHLTGQMREDLAIGKRTVDAGAHRAQVRLPEM